MHSLSNSVKKHRYFVDYLTKRKQTRRDAHPAASPEENRIETQLSGLDPEKEEGPDGYAVFAALTQTAETEIKPDRNPAKRIRSGKEEQRNEREMTFGAKQKSRRKRYEACDDAWCRRRGSNPHPVARTGF